MTHARPERDEPAVTGHERDVARRIPRDRAGRPRYRSYLGRGARLIIERERARLRSDQERRVGVVTAE